MGRLSIRRQVPIIVVVGPMVKAQISLFLSDPAFINGPERERERGRLYKRAITDPPSIQKESLSRRQNPDRKGPLTKWVELRIIHCDKRDINRKAT